MESSLTELGVPLAPVKLVFAQKFLRDTNLSWINVESCSTARLTWPLMDGRCSKQLLGLGRDIICCHAYGSLRYGQTRVKNGAPI